MEPRQPAAGDRVRRIAECGVAASLTLVLASIRVFQLPMGGSVTAGAAVPLWLLARRHGAAAAIVAGACAGGLQFCLTGSPVVHWAQPFIDYGLGWAVLGLGGLGRGGRLAAAAFSAFLRFQVHVLSGLLFYRQFAFQNGYTPMAWTLAYNASYMVPDAALALYLYALLGARLEPQASTGPAEGPGAPGRSLAWAGPGLAVLLSAAILLAW